MTRQDLVNKSIDKLNTVKEALELIEILEYDECIAVLTGIFDVCMNGDDLEFKKGLVRLQKMQNEYVMQREND